MPCHMYSRQCASSDNAPSRPHALLVMCEARDAPAAAAAALPCHVLHDGGLDRFADARRPADAVSPGGGSENAGPGSEKKVPLNKP